MSSRLVLSIVLAALALLAAPPLAGADYAVDLDHSNVQFSVPVLAVSKVTGKFMRYDVKIAAGKARDFSQASVTAVIEIASVDTGSDSWDGKHAGVLRRAEVPRHPLPEPQNSKGEGRVGGGRAAHAARRDPGHHPPVHDPGPLRRAAAG